LTVVLVAIVDPSRPVQDNVYVIRAVRALVLTPLTPEELTLFPVEPESVPGKESPFGAVTLQLFGFTNCTFQ
jgi:hypothetical protein